MYKESITRFRSGPLLSQLVSEDDSLHGVVEDTACVPDNIQDIRTKLVTWSDTGKADIFLTTCGTGFAARNVTPETTLSVLDCKLYLHACNIQLHKSKLDVVGLRKKVKFTISLSFRHY